VPIKRIAVIALAVSAVICAFCLRRSGAEKEDRTLAQIEPNHSTNAEPLRERTKSVRPTRRAYNHIVSEPENDEEYVTQSSGDRSADTECTDSYDCDGDSELAVKPPLTRESLDTAIDFGQPDFAWTRQVEADLARAIEVWPQAKLDETKCSVRLCRVKFSAESALHNVEALIDRINAVPAVSGERMIQIDTDAVPAMAVAYFSRDGAISLSAYSQ
jgi:hypothetical protein